MSILPPKNRCISVVNFYFMKGGLLLFDGRGTLLTLSLKIGHIAFCKQHSKCDQVDGFTHTVPTYTHTLYRDLLRYF